MPDIVDLLEEKRKQLGLGQLDFLRHLGLPHKVQSFYSRIASRKKAVPVSWLPQISKALGIQASELQKLVAVKEKNQRRREREYDPCRAYSTEELQEYARIVEFVGRPLTMRVLARLAEELKMAGSS